MGHFSRAKCSFETPDNKTKKVRDSAECPQCGRELVSGSGGGGGAGITSGGGGGAG